jgi:hypothetical protein
VDEILSLEAAREHLRVGDEASDTHLADLIETAESLLSDYLGRPLIDPASWASAAEVPKTVVHALKLILTELYEDRATPLTDMKAIELLVGRHVVISFG